MGTRTVIVTIGTVSQVFPVGTVEDPGYAYALKDSSGGVISSLTTTNTSVSFPLVQIAPGYTAVVSKNGVQVSQAFDVVEPTGAIEVPQSITIGQV